MAADTVGLVFGLPGLVVACADLYNLTARIRYRARDVNIIVDRVAVEQWRFACWLHDVGFSEGSKAKLRLPPAAQKMMLHLLQDIKETLELLDGLIEKYKEEDAKPESSTKGVNPPDHFFRLNSRLREQAKSRLPKPVKKVVDSAVRPLTWAAGEKERADKLLEDLKSLNEGLNLISDRLSNTKASMLPSRILPYIWNQDNLQNLIEATTQHDPELAHCAEIKKEVLASAEKDLAENKKPGAVSKASPLKFPALRLSKRVKSVNSRLIAAEYNNKATGTMEHVLLEDRSYAEGPQPQYEKFVETRVGEVAAILAKSKPARMKVLDCVGYVHNRADKTFSFVFRFPDEVKKDIPPTSLQKLLPLGQASWIDRPRRDQDPQGHVTPKKPALSMRFVMAKSLSQSLALLLACGVVHKGIVPANILFFSPEGTGQTDSLSHTLSRPYIAGFSWARLHGPKYISDTAPSADFASTSGLLHAHPAYSFTAEQRYLKIFDAYSLGLVLLQIALWRPISDIADELFPSAKSSLNIAGCKLEETLENSDQVPWLQKKVADWQAEVRGQQQLVNQSDGISTVHNPRVAFRQILVQNLERLLLAEVGALYMRVVARCLTSDIDNDGLAQNIIDKTSDEQEPDHVFLDAYLSNIVEELNKCTV